MKRKLHGSISILIMVLAIGAMALYAVTRSGKALPGGAVPFQKAPPALSFPGPADLQIMARLSERMTELQTPHATDREPGDLVLFGYRPVAVPGYPRSPDDTVDPDLRPYRLTFTFSAGQKRFCIIDGMFYRPGSQLPDESRVVRIEPRRVMVEKNGASKWIALSGSNLPGAPRAPFAGRNARHPGGK